VTVTLNDGASRPTAGALRLVEARTTTPGTVEIADYVRRVAAHCPFLAPSVERGLTGWTVYEAAGEADAVEAEVFHAGVRAAEWVRPLASRPYGVLVCENIVILGDSGVSHGEPLAWPHWALKHLYAPVGVMFGKFCKGEESVGTLGRDIPPPPFSFLPVRASIRSRDPRFLEDTPDLAASLAAAVDDGRDVFEYIPNDWKAVRAWATSLSVPRKH
jgi:hypothetical protein